MSAFDFLLKFQLFKGSLAEQIEVLDSFWRKGANVLSGSGIRIGPIPKEWTTLKHNYFSVLFIALFHTLGIPHARLGLYARLNHCLRAWVTACDNLLDDELKELIITDLPQDAKIFKSVLTLLLTDRIFFSFLLDGVKAQVITREQMIRLNSKSLAAICESGLEEAQEEGGIDTTIPPEEILDKIHYAKTGRLFTSPLTAPIELGDLDPDDPRVSSAWDGLLQLGIGCQILDDISDLAMDLHDNKHNYLATLIRHRGNKAEKEALDAIEAAPRNRSFREREDLYQQFPHASKKALEAAFSRLEQSMQHLGSAGLPLSDNTRTLFIQILTELYGQPHALMHLRDR